MHEKTDLMEMKTGRRKTSKKKKGQTDGKALFIEKIGRAANRFTRLRKRSAS